LDLLTEDPRIPGLKEIRGSGTTGLITLRDLKDSPLPDDLPYPAPSSPLNEAVTFWVSDGSLADSDDVIVQAVDEGTDRISNVPTGTPTPEPVVSYDFEVTNDGWTFTAPSANTYDSTYTGATSAYDTHKLGVIADNVTNRFGFWGSPAGSPITYEAGKLYKFMWQVNTNQADPLLVPVFRMRINEVSSFSSSIEMVITSANGALSPPTSGSKEYDQFFMPIHAGNMAMSFDGYDFDTAIGGETGQVSLEAVDVVKMTPPPTGWTPVTVTNFSSWTLTNGVGVYNNFATTGNTGTSLQLGSTLPEDRGYAFWSSQNISWTAGKFMHAVFTLTSASGANTTQGGLNAGSTDFNWRLRLKFNAAAVPGVTPTDYPIFFKTESGAQFFLVWEGYDFDNITTNGTNTLSAVTLEQNDLIP
jgi:hypothetical protein